MSKREHDNPDLNTYGNLILRDQLLTFFCLGIIMCIMSININNKSNDVSLMVKELIICNTT